MSTSTSSTALSTSTLSSDVTLSSSGTAVSQSVALAEISDVGDDSNTEYSLLLVLVSSSDASNSDDSDLQMPINESHRYLHSFPDCFEEH